MRARFGKSGFLLLCNSLCKYHQLENKNDVCQSQDQLKEDLGNLYDTLSKLKDNLRLDLDTQNLENQCQPVNNSKLFLKVYKLKEKFHYLIKQNSEKKTVLRELSSCVIEKFNRCKIFHVEFSKNLRQPFHPIDILYRPVKNAT